MCTGACVCVHYAEYLCVCCVYRSPVSAVHSLHMEVSVCARHVCTHLPVHAYALQVLSVCLGALRVPMVPCACLGIHMLCVEGKQSTK